MKMWCCGGGKRVVAPLQPLSPDIDALFEKSSVRQHARPFNNQYVSAGGHGRGAGWPISGFLNSHVPSLTGAGRAC